VPWSGSKTIEPTLALTPTRSRPGRTTLLSARSPGAQTTTAPAQSHAAAAPVWTIQQLASAPLRLDLSANWHHQDSFYGDTPYRATQGVAFAQGVWAPQLGAHNVMVGSTVRLQRYRDSTRAQQTSDTRFIPGLLLQDELALGSRVTVLAGVRADHHVAHGVISSPRLAVKVTPDEHTTIRVNAATGFRVVSLFTEDHAALTGAREVRITEALRPERSATTTLSANRVFDVGGIEDVSATLAASAARLATDRAREELSK
jgi:outer membrane receptor protein involved in Fe transport